MISLNNRGVKSTRCFLTGGNEKIHESKDSWSNSLIHKIRRNNSLARVDTYFHSKP